VSAHREKVRGDNVTQLQGLFDQQAQERTMFLRRGAVHVQVVNPVVTRVFARLVYSIYAHSVSSVHVRRLVSSVYVRLFSIVYARLVPTLAPGMVSGFKVCFHKWVFLCRATPRECHAEEERLKSNKTRAGQLLMHEHSRRVEDEAARRMNALGGGHDGVGGRKNGGGLGGKKIAPVQKKSTVAARNTDRSNNGGGSRAPPSLGSDRYGRGLVSPPLPLPGVITAVIN
jgi:hypothetical protein